MSAESLVTIYFVGWLLTSAILRTIALDDLYGDDLLISTLLGAIWFLYLPFMGFLLLTEALSNKLKKSMPWLRQRL
jgi:hypothetical protein